MKYLKPILKAKLRRRPGEALKREAKAFFKMMRKRKWKLDDVLLTEGWE